MAGKEKENPKLSYAIHKKDGPKHIVGFGNLRVLITNDDGSWFAKALEIDYAAEGSSFEEVTKRFENGLQATISEHLKVFGNIENLLQIAPKEIWIDLMKSAKLSNVYSHVSVHVIHEALPFEGIAYFEKQTALA